MREGAVIAVDCGTSRVRAAAYDMEGNILAAAGADPVTEKPSLDAFIQYGDDFLGCAVRALKETAALIGGRAVEAVVFTGQMAGLMGADADLNCVSEWSGTIDTRSRPDMERLAEAGGERFAAVCGSHSPFMAAKVNMFRRLLPGFEKKAEKYLVVTHFVAAKLCGLSAEEAFIDRTYLTWTGLADIAADAWSPELCGIAGVDIRKLPRIVPCNSVAGRLTPAFAAATGIPSGTPVIVGAGDKPAGCLGAGACEPGWFVNEFSTVGALSMCADRFVPDLGDGIVETLPAALPGQYYALSYISGSGVALDWFADTFGAALPREDGDEGLTVLQRLDRAAARVAPGAEGVLSVSVLGGRALPPQPDVRGVFAGHSWMHGVPHFYRAFLEGQAHEFRMFLEAMRALHPDTPPKGVIAVGGGAKSAVFRRILCDDFNLPLHTIKRKEASLFGAWLLAMNALGARPDLAAASRGAAEFGESCAPGPETAEFYRKHCGIYKTAVEGMRQTYAALSAINKK